MNQKWIDYLKALRQYYLEAVEWAVSRATVNTTAGGETPPPTPPKPPKGGDTPPPPDTP